MCGSACVTGGGVGIALYSSGALVWWFWNSSCHLLMMSNCWYHHTGPHASSNKCCCPLLPSLFGPSQVGQAATDSSFFGKWWGWGESSPVTLLFCFTRPAPLGREGEHILPACKKEQMHFPKFLWAIKLFCWISVSVDLIFLGDLFLTTWMNSFKHYCTSVPNKSVNKHCILLYRYVRDCSLFMACSGYMIRGYWLII